MRDAGKTVPVTGAGELMGLWPAMRGFLAALAAHVGRRWPGIVALVVAGALIEGAGVLLLVPILALVLDRGGGIAAPAFAAVGLTTPGARLAALLAGFLALMAARSLVLHRRDVGLAELQTGFVEGVRNRAIAALAAARWEAIVGLQHARVTNLLGADIGRIAQATHLLVNGAVAAAMLAIQLGIAVALAPLLAGGVAAALLIGLAATLRRAGRTRAGGAALAGAHLRLMQDTTGFLAGLKAAMAEDAGDRFVADFAAGQADLRHHGLDFVRRQSRGRAAFALASAAGAIAVIGAGVALAVPSAVLAALIVLFARMAGPAAALQAAFGGVVFGLPSFEAVRALEDDLGTPRAVGAARVPPPGGVSLDAATFRHPGGGGIVEATLAVAPGEIVGLSGPSGAGKTTLVDLLTGLVAPQSGVLRVGGAVLDDAGRTGWRQAIGYVAQDGLLFHGSVRDNLGVHDPDAIAHALAVTGADAVVARLPGGLDTPIGERGARLSGGERQRIAIARALLRRPRLLVLDEATSAIDVAGEAAVLAALAGLSPRPAILIVAHRAESLARCDRIVAVRDGRIVSPPA